MYASRLRAYVISAIFASGLLLPGIATAETKSIGISTIVEVPQLVETKDGVIAALADRGFVVGQNLKIDYQNANGNAPTQQQIARKFVGDRLDLIVAITTPTAQAMVAATKDIPIVFATVTDPLKAKLIEKYEQPGGNVTGVSDAAPLAEQVALFGKIKPELKRLGFLYNPGLDSSKATLERLQEVAQEAGITIVEAAAPTTNEVMLAVRKLVGQVDAIYIPNDTTVVSSLESVVKIGEETKTPVFTGETRGVDRGAIASMGVNYIEVGRLAGEMVADILEGKKPGEINAVIANQVKPDFVIVLNEAAAERMGAPIPTDVLATATRLVK